MYANEKPYKDITLYKLERKIIEGERPDLMLIPPQYSKYKKRIQKCREADPSDRPSFDEIVHLLETDQGFIIDTVDEDDFHF